MSTCAAIMKEKKGNNINNVPQEAVKFDKEKRHKTSHYSDS